MSTVVFYDSKDEIIAQYIGIGYQNISYVDAHGAYKQKFRIVQEKDEGSVTYVPENRYVARIEIQK